MPPWPTDSAIAHLTPLTGVMGVRSGHGAVQASSQKVPPMSDKSPRQSKSVKSGKTIKEKRAEKRNKGSEETFSDKIHSKKQ